MHFGFEVLMASIWGSAALSDVHIFLPREISVGLLRFCRSAGGRMGHGNL